MCVMHKISYSNPCFPSILPLLNRSQQVFPSIDICGILGILQTFFPLIARQNAFSTINCMANTGKFYCNIKACSLSEPMKSRSFFFFMMNVLLNCNSFQQMDDDCSAPQMMSRVWSNMLFFFCSLAHLFLMFAMVQHTVAIHLFTLMSMLIHISKRSLTSGMLSKFS